METPTSQKKIACDPTMEQFHAWCWSKVNNLAPGMNLSKGFLLAKLFVTHEFLKHHINPLIHNVRAEGENALDFNLMLRQNVYKPLHPGILITIFNTDDS